MLGHAHAMGEDAESMAAAGVGGGKLRVKQGGPVLKKEKNFEPKS